MQTCHYELLLVYVFFGAIYLLKVLMRRHAYCMILFTVWDQPSGQLKKTWQES